MIIDQRVWFVARTSSFGELSIRNIFVKLKINFFIPVRNITKKNNNGLRHYESVIIPNLVFFHSTPSEAQYLFRILSTRLFRIIDYIHGGLLTIPNEQMERFIAFIETYEDNVKMFNDSLFVGDHVAIKNGPLRGLEGILVKKGGKNHFVVRLEGILTVAAKIPIKELRKTIKK